MVRGQTSRGFNYSIVDMSLNNGLGAITSKNNNLLNFSSEKITSTFKNPDGSSIWVITFASNDGNIDSVFIGKIIILNIIHFMLLKLTIAV